MSRLSFGRNLSRTFSAICLVAGSLLYLIAQIVGPDTDEKNKSKELANVAAHKGSYLLSALLFMIAALVTIVGLIGVIHLFKVRRSGFGQAAATLLLVGNTVIVGFYAFSSVEYEMVNQKGIDRAAMAKLLHETDNAASSAPLFVLFLVGVVLGLLLLAVAIWRRKVAPVWVSVCLVATAVVGFFGNSKGLGIVSFALLVIALTGLALSVLGVTDEEWELSRPGGQPGPSGEPVRTAA